jgi:hypothetical protein
VGLGDRSLKIGHFHVSQSGLPQRAQCPGHLHFFIIRGPPCYLMVCASSVKAPVDDLGRHGTVAELRGTSEMTTAKLVQSPILEVA